jgi:hypothetical protein
MSEHSFALDVADQQSHDLLVERFTDSESTEVSWDVQNAASFVEVLNIAANGVFLHPR